MNQNLVITMSALLTYDQKEAAAKEYILNPSDGPVTDFVAIGRAIELARAGVCPVGKDTHHDPIANALDDVLGNRGRTLVEGNGS